MKGEFRCIATKVLEYGIDGRYLLVIGIAAKVKQGARVLGDSS
jgi:hypothetical protein